VTLTTTDEERDLGVIISSNLKPSAQCLKAANKAMSVLGMVRRNFPRLDTASFNIIYKGYIRPHLCLCTGVVSHLGEGQISVRDSSAKSHQIGVWIKEQEL